jgi:hypothetical protein
MIFTLYRQQGLSTANMMHDLPTAYIIFPPPYMIYIVHMIFPRLHNLPTVVHDLPTVRMILPPPA